MVSVEVALVGRRQRQDRGVAEHSFRGLGERAGRGLPAEACRWNTGTAGRSRSGAATPSRRTRSTRPPAAEVPDCEVLVVPVLAAIGPDRVKAEQQASFTLGVQPTSALELANAGATLASHGTRNQSAGVPPTRTAGMRHVLGVLDLASGSCSTGSGTANGGPRSSTCCASCAAGSRPGGSNWSAKLGRTPDGRCPHLVRRPRHRSDANRVQRVVAELDRVRVHRATLLHPRRLPLLGAPR